MHSLRQIPLALATIAVSLAASTGAVWAGGPNSVDIDHLQIAATRSDFLATEGAGQVPPWAWRVGAAFRYLDRPLVLEVDGSRSPMVTNRAVLELGGSIQVGRWVGVGLVLPAVLHSASAATAEGAALGDLRIVPRVELWHSERFGAALVLGLRVPTGASRRLLGEGMPLFEPRLALQADLARHVVRIGLNLGARLRQTRTLYDLAVGHEAIATIALAFVPRPYIEGIVEVQAATPLGAGFATKQASPVEVLLGARGGWAGVRAGVAVGLGVVDGFGAPRVRALVTIEYQRLRSAPFAVAPPVTPTPPRPIPSAPAPAPAPPRVPVPPPVIDDDPGIEAEPDVKFVAGRIELGHPIFFQKDRKRVRTQFHGELVQLARALLRRPAITVVWIEGHADATGPHAWNLELSRQRAAQVARFLAEHGVERARLRPVGFGEAQPLDRFEGRGELARNRRVQFFTETTPSDDKPAQNASSEGASALGVPPTISPRKAYDAR